MVKTLAEIGRGCKFNVYSLKFKSVYVIYARSIDKNLGIYNKYVVKCVTTR